MRNDYKEKTEATNSGHIWRGMGAIGWHESLSLLPSNIKEKIGEKMKRRGPGCPHTTPCSNGWSQFNTLSFYMVRSSSSSSSPLLWGSSPPPPHPLPTLNSYLHLHGHNNWIQEPNMFEPKNLRGSLWGEKGKKTNSFVSKGRHMCIHVDNRYDNVEEEYWNRWEWEWEWCHLPLYLPHYNIPRMGYVYQSIYWKIICKLEFSFSFLWIDC